MSGPQVQIVDVFPAAPGGGNPAPIVTAADGMDARAMLAVAQDHGHESGFVLAPDEGSGAQFRFRFFVPRQEVEMCGHATIGALWLLHREGRITTGRMTIQTASGPVIGRVGDGDCVRISQPRGTVEPLLDDTVRAELLALLRLPEAALLPVPLVNARTSRTKTLIGLASEQALHGLEPDLARIEAFCERIGSTGLYPYAADPRDAGVFHARQFPKSSGYPEDAATGIAATALAFGLRALALIAPGTGGITVRQGEAMGRPSALRVDFADPGDADGTGCWLGGRVSRHDPG